MSRSVRACVSRGERDVEPLLRAQLSAARLGRVQRPMGRKSLDLELQPDAWSEQIWAGFDFGCSWQRGGTAGVFEAFSPKAAGIFGG